MTDLIADLERGPGSRALSDEVLLAKGYTTKEYVDPGLSADYGEDVVCLEWFSPSGEALGTDRPNVTEVTDDALALVPEGLTCAMDLRHDALVYLEQQVLTDYGQGFQIMAEAKAQGENPLPRAICIAVLKVK